MKKTLTILWMLVFFCLGIYASTTTKAYADNPNKKDSKLAKKVEQAWETQKDFVYPSNKRPQFTQQIKIIKNPYLELKRLADRELGEYWKDAKVATDEPKEPVKKEEGEDEEEGEWDDEEGEWDDEEGEWDDEEGEWDDEEGEWEGEDEEGEWEGEDEEGEWEEEGEDEEEGEWEEE